MGALRTKKFTQLKTQYVEPGAEHSLFIHKTDDGQDVWVPCGTWTNRADAIKAQDYIELYGQCGACNDQFYCPYKGAGRIDCKKFK